MSRSSFCSSSECCLYLTQWALPSTVTRCRHGLPADRSAHCEPQHQQQRLSADVIVFYSTYSTTHSDRWGEREREICNPQQVNVPTTHGQRTMLSAGGREQNSSSSDKVSLFVANKYCNKTSAGCPGDTGDLHRWTYSRRPRPSGDLSALWLHVVSTGLYIIIIGLWDRNDGFAVLVFD